MGSGSPLVTIDGPAGAGKSEAARALARRLLVRYVDSGSIYRAITLEALDRGFDLDDTQALQELAAELKIEVETDPAKPPLVKVNGTPVTTRLRSPRVDETVSLVAKVPGVRQAVTRLLWDLSQGAVVEGRDMGSVVFPGVRKKIFLDANFETRVERRSRQAGDWGSDSTEHIEEDLRTRDEIDQLRESAPLRIPQGALVIDSTRLSVGEVVDRIVLYLNSK